MTIPAVPTVPNPLGTNFANDALAFTQWMAAAAPEFDAAANSANLSQSGAQDAATQAGLARDAAVVAQGAASDSAGAAALASSAATGAKIAAEAARDSAANTYINFDQRFLGDKAVPPTTDNQGGPLVEGALYYNTVQKSMRVWSGSGWDAAYLASGAYQETLVSGANIKTVNGQNLLGYGDLASVGPLARLAKSAAYTASAADKGAIIDCTGTWTLGFAAAATLGAGWWCYVRNVGTGTITADPNGAELIDGVTGGAIRPGMTLLIQCDGTAFHCMRVGPHVAMEILTSGTSWTVPLGVRVARFRLTNGGSPGRVGNGTFCGPGGRGGSTAEFISAITPGTAYTYAIGASAGTTSMVIDGVTYTGANASGRGQVIAGFVYTTAVFGTEGQPGGQTITGFGKGGDGIPTGTANAGEAGGIILEY